MKLNKIFTLATLATAMFFTASCSEDFDYTAAEAPSGAQVYFPSEAPTQYSISEDGASFSIPLKRANTSGSLSVPLKVSGTEGTIYTVSDNASFNDGSESASIVVNYDASRLEYGRYDTLTIAINDASLTTPYGVSELTIVAGVTAWVDYGVAQYREDLMTTFYGVENVVYEVPIQKNVVKEGYYRLVNPYGEYYPYNDPGDWDESVDSYMVINATDPDWVYVEDCETTTDWGYGAISMYGYVYYLMLNGNSLDAIKASKPDIFGTLKDGIITMPAQSLLISMADYNSGGLYYANGSGMFGIAMPGAAFADYAIEVSYAGIFTDANSNVFAVGNLTLGEDATTVKAVVMSASDDAAAVAAAIASGELEATDVAAGRIEVPVAEGLSGKLQLIAVVLGGGEVKAISTANFEYYGGSASPWIEVGTGTYTYTTFFADYDEETDEDIPVEDGPLTIYQNSEDPTSYKVTDWGYGAEFFFTWDGENEVTVPVSSTGYVHSSYGVIYVSDFPNYGNYSYDNYPCTYDADTQTFTFTVIYWIQQGYFAYGQETLKVDWNAAAARGLQAKHTTAKPSSNLKLIKGETPFSSRFSGKKVQKAKHGEFKNPGTPLF